MTPLREYLEDWLRSQLCVLSTPDRVEAMELIQLIHAPRSPTKKLTEKQIIVRALRDLVSPDLTPHGASIEIIQKINDYKGHRWSIDIERQRAPKDQEQHLIHRLLILIDDKTFPEQKTFYRWLL